MNNPEPKLSIVIPLFNTEKYIEQCIRSIVENAIDPTLYEVIVVDDGSTDSSALIVNQLCAAYGNIHLIQQANHGVSSARKRGIVFAHGDFCWFIDSDDWLLKDALPRIINLIETVPNDIEIIHAPLRIYHNEKEDKLSTPIFFVDGSILSGKDLLKSGHISVCPPEFVFRRYLIKKPFVYFPEKTRHEDEYFCRVLQYSCGKILQINDPFYAYRQHDHSFMHSGGIQSAQGLVNVYKHLSDFTNNYVEEKDRDWFRKENLSLLTATHFWFPELIGTPDFGAFREQNSAFILSEFKKYQYLLDWKDRLIGRMILRMPSIFKWHYKHQLQHKKRAETPHFEPQDSNDD